MCYKASVFPPCSSLTWVCSHFVTTHQPSQPVIDIMANQNMQNPTQPPSMDKATTPPHQNSTPPESNSGEKPTEKPIEKPSASYGASTSASSLFKDVDAKMVEEEGRKDTQNAAAFKSENGNVDFRYSLVSIHLPSLACTLSALHEIGRAHV